MRLRYIIIVLSFAINILAFDRASDSLVLVSIQNSNPNSLISDSAEGWNLTHGLEDSKSNLTITIEENRITSLTIVSRQIDSIPPDIGNLTELKSLYLLNNSISHLPNEIGNLVSLTELYLNNNQLSSLPPEIGNLVNLTKFFIHENQLTTLPSELINLGNISLLNLYNNNIDSVPNSLGKMKKLSNIILNSNQLEILPFNPDSFPSLIYLYLDNNKLSALPDNICNLTNLTHLDLSDNKLITIPSEINKLIGLEYLEVDMNQLPFGELEKIDWSGGIMKTYAPQDTIGNIDTIQKDTGNILTLASGISGTNNLYVWRLNDSIVRITPDDTIQIKDSGKYTCSATNESFPGLKLYHAPIIVMVDKTPIITNAETKINLGVRLVNSTLQGRGYFKVDLYDLKGRQYHLFKGYLNGSINLDFRQLASGVYFSNVIDITSGIIQKTKIKITK